MTVSGKDILCLATQEWDANWTPVQHVMLRLAPENRVLYFEPFHPPLAWLKPNHALLRRQRQEGVPRLREVHPNLWVYRPGAPYLPWNMKVPAFERFNGRLYRREIASVLRRMEMRSPWLWAFFAQSLSVLDLPFERFIYDCVDEWPAFFPDPRENRFITRIDDALCRRAEILFVGSQPLYEKKSKMNAKTFVVNHAADIAHFAKATDPATVVPDDLERVPRPRIGFVGMVDGVRFDVDLISELAGDPGNQVAIIGGFIGDARKSIPQRPNVHCLGMKAVADLPAYLKGLDVLLMPYRINEATRNIYPLKLHEYMATGKPVVATAIPAVEEFRDLLYVADRREEYAGLVKRALGETDPQLRARRRACADAHDWQGNVDRKAALIAEHLPGPAAGRGSA